MKNGNVYEFVDHIHYGDELWFLYRGKKYFLEGWGNEGKTELYLFEMWGNGKTYLWKGDAKHFPVEEFLKAKIWDGRPFWDAEQDMIWVDDDTYIIKNEP